MIHILMYIASHVLRPVSVVLCVLACVLCRAVPLCVARLALCVFLPTTKTFECRVHAALLRSAKGGTATFTIDGLS